MVNWPSMKFLSLKFNWLFCLVLVGKQDACEPLCLVVARGGGKF